MRRKLTLRYSSYEKEDKRVTVFTRRKLNMMYNFHNKKAEV
jgi:hypothetical protein